MIKFFNWIKSHLPTKRRLIQVYSALLYNCNIKGFVSGRIFKGDTKYACVPGLNCYSCPGAVGACPLGAMQNAFASSGNRAPFYILGILGLYGLMLGRTICGFLCPVGLGQDLLNKVKSPKLKKSRYTRALSYLKYVILVVFAIIMPIMYGVFQNIAVPGFCKYICPAGTFGGGLGLMINPANESYLRMLGPLFTWKFALMVAIIVACIFIYRPFCRFICPLGAIYGFFNKLAFLGVTLDESKCTDCGLCVSHCKMDIKHVGDHECINCGECIKVCPVEAISWKGSKIFLRGNAVTEPVVEEKPFNLLTSSQTEKSEIALTEQSNLSSSDGTSAPEIEPVTPSADNNGNKNNKPVRNKKFYLELTAWCLALVVFIGSFVYFNAFAATENVNAVKVGEDCPSFSLQTYSYDSNGNVDLTDAIFNISEHKGEVVVVNFWQTWCGPCVAELPHFNRFKQEHPEVTIVALHDEIVRIPVDDFIANTFPNFEILFLQDQTNIVTQQTTYTMLGGKDAWPMTVIIDKQGVVQHIIQGSITYDKLCDNILPLI